VTTTKPVYTTSTVYTTEVETITSCPPYVTKCPAHVITKTIPLYTTVCPVSTTEKPHEETTKAPETTKDHGEEYTTSTVYTTAIYTVTKCPPEVTDCPLGSVTTKTVPLYTTVCPITSATVPEETHVVTTEPGKEESEYSTTTMYSTYTKTRTVSEASEEEEKTTTIESTTTSTAYFTVYPTTSTETPTIEYSTVIPLPSTPVYSSKPIYPTGITTLPYPGKNESVPTQPGPSPPEISANGASGMRVPFTWSVLALAATWAGFALM
jgi:chitinase